MGYDPHPVPRVWDGRGYGRGVRRTEVEDGVTRGENFGRTRPASVAGVGTGEGSDVGEVTSTWAGTGERGDPDHSSFSVTVTRRTSGGGVSGTVPGRTVSRRVGVGVASSRGGDTIRWGREALRRDVHSPYTPPSPVGPTPKVLVSFFEDDTTLISRHVRNL